MNELNTAKTKNKKKRRWVGWIIALAVLVVMFMVGAMFCSSWSQLNKEHKEAASVPLAELDFGSLKDGVYIGKYAGGMYGWRYNKVQVTVSGGKVTDIQVLEQKEEKKPDFLQALFKRVMNAQSLQVDTISGATLTSQAYLKGVEDALMQAQGK